MEPSVTVQIDPLPYRMRHLAAHVDLNECGKCPRSIVLKEYGRNNTYCLDVQCFGRRLAEGRERFDQFQKEQAKELGVKGEIDSSQLRIEGVTGFKHICSRDFDQSVCESCDRRKKDIRFNNYYICLTPSHPYGPYFGGARNASVNSDVDGTYYVGSGAFDHSIILKITPIVSIDGWTHADGGFRNRVWVEYDYWADHDCDLPVVWSFAASMDWLSIDCVGNLTGTGKEGTCYYRITATAANGETVTVGGYIVVEVSSSQAALSSVGPLIGVFIAVLLFSSVVVRFQRIRLR